MNADAESREFEVHYVRAEVSKMLVKLDIVNEAMDVQEELVIVNKDSCGAVPRV